MTREQKLALIIGFSLILAVGVLISDHLSRAQSDPIVADQAIDQPMIVPRLADVPPSLGETMRPIPGRDAVRMDSIAANEPAVRETLPGMGNTYSQGERERSPAGIRVSPRESVAAGRPTETVREETRESPRVEESRSLAQAPLKLDLFERVDGFPVPGTQIIREPDARPSEVASRLTPREIVAVEPKKNEPQPVRHLVSEGESLYSIAEKYYGNGNLWPKLAEANTGRVNEKGHVFKDAEILVPVREGMRIPSETGRVALTKASETGVPGPRYATYTIQKGDTLSEITQELMGTVRRMDELIELNSDQINDANDIRVGMKLRYPEDERA